MGLVILAALFGAAIFLLFHAFERRNVALLPAIAVNYLVAAIIGSVYAHPWIPSSFRELWLPCLGIGALFIGSFVVTGISSQRAGVTATTVANKLSVVLTVLFAVVMYRERPGMLGWLGIGCAVLAVVLSSFGADGASRNGKAWSLPVLVLLGAAAIDISINALQRSVQGPGLDAVIPALCFAWACPLSFLLVWRLGQGGALRERSTWSGGALLGAINFGAMFFLVRALGSSGMPSSTVFPLLNISTIILGTAGSMLLFGERPRTAQYAGIACAVIALVLLLIATP